MTAKEFEELIIRLADCGGVSGGEAPAAAVCLEILKKYTDKVEYKNGNVLAHFGERSGTKPHVLIDAHLDRVGLIVTGLTEGFVRAECIGGQDIRIFPAGRVLIHGREDIPGVICTLPPHLKKDSSVMKSDSIYIDTLMCGEELGELVSPGDFISLDSPCTALLNGRLCGAGLDDRCGVAAVIKAVDGLSGRYDSLPFTFTVMFSSQEELGERGACIGAFDVDPDIAVAVDVSFGMCGGEEPKKCGELAGGCMIGISPSLDRSLSDWFISYAGEKHIPFQYEVMNGKTGTNADRFTVNRGGAAAVTLSIPLRYMHTPCEVIDIGDCEKTAELITAFLREGEYPWKR